MTADPKQVEQMVRLVSSLITNGQKLTIGEADIEGDKQEIYSVVLMAMELLDDIHIVVNNREYSLTSWVKVKGVPEVNGEEVNKRLLK